MGSVMIGAALFSCNVLAEDVRIVPVKRLTLDTALQVAQGAIEACRERGIQIAVTLVDRDGTVQVTLRDTIAAPITAPISRMKAFTAVNFNASTADLSGRANSAIARIDGLLMAPGGVPIRAAGALVGGVGVSGAPSGETDQACAEAGIANVIEELEMAF